MENGELERYVFSKIKSCSACNQIITINYGKKYPLCEICAKYKKEQI